MAYQIAKGWPSQGAVDEIIAADTGAAVAPGMIAVIKTNGKAGVADYAADGSDADLQAAFVIDMDKVRLGNFTALMSRSVITCDAEHYAPGAYTPMQLLTAKGGKLAAKAGTEPTVAKVLSFNATTGAMRVLWVA